MGCRYKLELSYCGTAYHGWQTQTVDLPTIQATIEQQLAKLLRHSVHVHGCGRTDAGVHATGYVAHFDSDRGLDIDFAQQLTRALPADIAVHTCTEVDATFDAQRSAVARQYVYRFSFRKNPFHPGRVAQYDHLALDEQRMQAVVELYREQTDFAGFCRKPDQYLSTTCRIDETSLQRLETDGEYQFRITANRFLQNMVRLLVARMIDVGRGALSLDDLVEAFHSGKPPRWVNAAHAEGLYLSKVFYGAKADAPHGAT